MTKKLFFSGLVCLFAMLNFTSCSDDDENHSTNLLYKTTINKPDASMKMFGETMHIHVDFVSETNETIHHINVKIYEKDDVTKIVYNEPTEAHVHEESGTYSFHADFDLTAENEVAAYTDYILEAKVWGHEAEEAEVIETIDFHVHMQ